MTIVPSWCIPGWDCFFLLLFAIKSASLWQLGALFRPFFSQPLSLCLLVFLNLMKGPHSFFSFLFFNVLELLFRIPSVPSAFVRGGIPDTEGVPRLLACYLVSSSIKSTPQILPPPCCSLFVVSPAVDPDEEGLVWGTLVLMWRPGCQNWRLCWSLRLQEEPAPPPPA